MLEQAGSCWTCSDTTLFVFPRGGSNKEIKVKVTRGEIADLLSLKVEINENKHSIPRYYQDLESLMTGHLGRNGDI